MTNQSQEVYRSNSSPERRNKQKKFGKGAILVAAVAGFVVGANSNIIDDSSRDSVVDSDPALVDYNSISTSSDKFEEMKFEEIKGSPKIEMYPGEAIKIGMYDKEKWTSLENSNDPKTWHVNFLEVNLKELVNGETFVIDKEADVRTAPEVLDNSGDAHTAIFSIEQEAPLNNIKNYYDCRSLDYPDTHFIGFNSDDIEKIFPDAKIPDGVEIVWVEAEDVSFEKNDKS